MFLLHHVEELGLVALFCYFTLPVQAKLVATPIRGKASAPMMQDYIPSFVGELRLFVSLCSALLCSALLCSALLCCATEGTSCLL